MPNDLLETKRFFEINDIKLSDFWLQSCINWSLQHIGNESYTAKELYLKVYEQWLLLDLRDVEVPQLPPNIQIEKIILNKTLCLQLIYVMDISRSKLSQLQIIKNLNALTRDCGDNREDVPAPKRMLQLTLTDGLQEIKGIEYKPIPVLSVNLIPGTKIKITGPITIRRGQILLEPSNVKLLGGEVEELSISCAAENVLLRHLKLPENPNPAAINESLLYHNTVNNNKNTLFPTTLNKPNQNNKQTIIGRCNTVSENQNSTDERVKQNTLCKDTERRQNNSENETKDLANTDNEFEMLLEMEEEILNEYNEFANLETSAPPIESNITENTEGILNRQTSTVSANTSNKEANNQYHYNMELGDDLFNSLEIDKYLDEIERSDHISQKVSLKTILKYVKDSKFGKYKVHAKFKSIAQKLTVKDNKWFMQIHITDGDDNLPVYINDNIITEMIGFTAQEMINLTQKVAAKDHEVQSIMKALNEVKSKLLDLNCEMELDYNKSVDAPIITKLLGTKRRK